MSLDYGRRRYLADRLRRRRRSIAERVTDEFLARHPDWTERFGDLAWIRGEEDATFHLEFLAAAVMADSPEAYRDYARWTAGVLASRGIESTFLVENLDQVRQLAREELDEAETALVDRIADAAIGAVADGRGDEAADADEPFPTERSLYLQAILAGERRAALSVARETIRAGATVPDVYADILQPCQYALGRLWERNEITVAQEHMATAVTQYVVAQLYDQLEVQGTVRGTAVVSGVRGEFHQLGANMVADVLEADGWSVRFLGTQLPHAGVLEAIDTHEPRLVGLSATILLNLPAVADLVEAVRRRFGDHVSIMVGGGAFRASPNAWHDIGADGYGADLRDAVALGSRLVSGEGG